VKPISGKTGRPVPKLIDGISASLLCHSTAFALSTSVAATRTLVLFRCARSTTVASESCAGANRGASPASRNRRPSRPARSSHLIVVPGVDFKTKAPVPLCSREQGSEQPPFPATRHFCRPIAPKGEPAACAPGKPVPPQSLDNQPGSLQASTPRVPGCACL
jgi:hypothetical protein